MPFLPLLIAGELIASLLIINIGSHKAEVKQKVLGVSLIAQENTDTTSTDTSTSTLPSSSDNSPPPASENSPPAQSSSDQPTQSPSASSSNDQSNQTSTIPDSTSPSNGQTSSSTQTSSGSESTTTSSDQSIFSIYSTTPEPEQTNPNSNSAQPTEAPANNQPPPTTPEAQGQSSLANPPLETSVSQTESILNPTDLLNSPDAINSKSVEEIKSEATQLEQAKTPQEETKLLINFSVDKVKDITNFIKKDDFTSTNFASQRLNEDLNQAVTNLQNLPPKDKTQLQNQLRSFCQQADFVLRSSELSVPEQAEQDLEINRGICLNIK